MEYSNPDDAYRQAIIEELAKKLKSEGYKVGGSKSFKEFLYNQVALVLAVGGFVWGIFNFLQVPQTKFEGDIGGIRQDVALIQQSINTIQLNHEAHIQTAMEEIADSKAQIEEIRKEQNEQDKEIVRLMTILNQKIK